MEKRRLSDRINLAGKNRALAETYAVLHARNHQIIIQSTLNEQKLQTLKGRTDAKSYAYSMQHEDDGQSSALTAVMI